MASTLSTVHGVPWAGDGGVKKAAKIKLRNRKSREKRVNRGPYMVDANPYCFANPSITKRRAQRVRRFHRCGHDLATRLSARYGYFGDARARRHLGDTFFAQPVGCITERASDNMQPGGCI